MLPHNSIYLEVFSMHHETKQRLLLIILFFCLAVTGVAAQERGSLHESPLNFTSAPVNPDFLNYQAQRGERAYLTSADDYFIPGVVPSPIDFSHTKGMQIGSTKGDFHVFSTYPSSFDLRDNGKVSPVKNQGNEGNCWAFATYGSLESFFLPTEAWNFSENNMKNTLNPEFDIGEGGNRWMSTAYLSRWSGPILEEDDPYVACSTFIPEVFPPVKRVQKVIFLPQRADNLDNDNIKWALTEYGSVQVSFYWNKNGYNEETYAFYQKKKTISNHAVAIVGWDDTLSRTKFNIKPSGDGAFIVKNSWGTDWGDDGFFYLSYYDTSIKNFAVFTGEDTESYDRVYQYDPMGWIDSLGYDSDTGWFANIFTADLDETITAVGFYTPVVDSSYHIDVYTNPDDGPQGSGVVVSSTSGTIAYPGYTTVDIPPASLNAGERFSVIVQLETPGYNWPIPIEYACPDYSSKATANPGEGYISSLGAEWHDITEVSVEGLDMATASVCLKAFTTVSTLPQAVFLANTTSGKAPLTVTFTDASIGTPTAWYWYFGDGSESRVRNPVHTFTEVGNYTVQLTATNSVGQSMEWMPVTVDPAPTPAPVAAFIATPTNGTAPLKVQFTDQSTNTPTSWKWEYSTTGNGWTEFSTSKDPSHTFTTAGTYSIRLTATNASGSDFETKMEYVIVSSITGITIPINSTDGANDQLLVLGTDQAGTDGYDADLDVAAPPLPPSAVFHVVFMIPDQLFPRLYTDIRGEIDEAYPERTWQMEIITRDADAVLSWDPTLLPKDLTCTLIYSGKRYDMKSVITLIIPKEADGTVQRVEITLLSGMEMTTPLAAGWNLISVPYATAEYSIPSPSSIQVIYTYDPTTRAYTITPLEDMQPGKAYWVASMDDTEITMSGTDASPITSVLTAGWNLIGGMHQDIALGNIGIDPSDAWAMPFVYGYNTRTRAYEPTTTLQPGHGYWGAVTVDCSITIPAGVLSPQPPI
jgi:C1A family cysteine protease